MKLINENNELIIQDICINSLIRNIKIGELSISRVDYFQSKLMIYQSPIPNVLDSVGIPFCRAMPYATSKGNDVNLSGIQRIWLHPFAPLKIIPLNSVPGFAPVFRSIG